MAANLEVVNMEDVELEVFNWEGGTTAPDTLFIHDI